jgi:hypothetical protein
MACELAYPVPKGDPAVNQKEFSFAEPAGIENDLAGCRKARRVSKRPKSELPKGKQQVSLFQHM